MNAINPAEESESPPDGASRNARRKAETKGKLIDAARKVIGKRGFDATTIRDITDEADVGFGSFYNYFDSKEAICDAAVAGILTDFSRIIDASNEGVTRAPEKLANAVGNFVRRARLDPVISLFIIQVGSLRPELGSNVARSLVRDLNLGLEQGEFSLPDMTTSVAMISGALVNFLRERLLGDLTPDNDEHAVHMVLRMVGTREDEALRLSREFRRTPLNRP